MRYYECCWRKSARVGICPFWKIFPEIKLLFFIFLKNSKSLPFSMTTKSTQVLVLYNKCSLKFSLFWSFFLTNLNLYFLTRQPCLMLLYIKRKDGEVKSLILFLLSTFSFSVDNCPDSIIHLFKLDSLKNATFSN